MKLFQILSISCAIRGVAYRVMWCRNRVPHYKLCQGLSWSPRPSLDQRHSFVTACTSIFFSEKRLHEIITQSEYERLPFSSILYITVFDEDRFLEPEFLGRVGIPVATILNGTKLRRVLPLRDKTLSRYTKGTIEITVCKKWDPWKVRTVGHFS